MQQYQATMKNTTRGNNRFLLLTAICFILSLIVGTGTPVHAKNLSAVNHSGQTITCADTIITDSANEEKDQPEVIITKPKKKSKSVSQTPKAKNAGTAIDEDDDNDMYVPYEKWRIEKFDNWGTHRKAKSSGVKTETAAPDSTGDGKSNKEFNDKDKEL